MKKMFASAAILAFVMVVACKNETGTNETALDTRDSAATFNLSEVRSSIAENNKRFGEAIGKADSATVVSLYASDARIYPPNMPAMAGPEGVKRFAGAFSGMGVKELKLESTDVTGNADNVIEEGTYTIGDGTGKALDKGKYIVIWKQENGSWKMFRDIFNSDNPPSTPK